MAQTGSMIGKITEELGELGKKVVIETAKAPVDIAGQIFEGGGRKKGQQSGKQPMSAGTRPKSEKTPLDELDEITDEKQKQKKARPILQWWAGHKKEPPKPSVYEEIQTEKQQKKENTHKQAAASAWQQLPNTGAAPKRGDLRNIAKKQAGTETSKNMVNQ